MDKVITNFKKKIWSSLENSPIVRKVPSIPESTHWFNFTTRKKGEELFFSVEHEDKVCRILLNGID
jgi:hypothetical protein